MDKKKQLEWLESRQKENSSEINSLQSQSSKVGRRNKEIPPFLAEAVLDQKETKKCSIIFSFRWLVICNFSLEFSLKM